MKTVIEPIRRTTPEEREAILEVYERRRLIGGLRIVEEPRFLRHFSCRFAPC